MLPPDIMKWLANVCLKSWKRTFRLMPARFKAALHARCTSFHGSPVG
jgi:hypothetical protein